MGAIASPIVIFLIPFWFLIMLFSGQKAFSQNSLICFGIFIFLSFSSNILLDKYTNSFSQKNPHRYFKLCESNLNFKFFLCIGSFMLSSYLFGQNIVDKFIKYFF